MILCRHLESFYTKIKSNTFGILVGGLSLVRKKYFPFTPPGEYTVIKYKIQLKQSL